MVKVNIHGKMVSSILESLKMVWSMGKVNGRVVKGHNVTNMKVIMLMIKNKVLVSSLG